MLHPSNGEKWGDNPVKTVSLRFNERPCHKDKKWRIRGRHPTPTSALHRGMHSEHTHTGDYTLMHHVYSHTKKEKKQIITKNRVPPDIKTRMT